MTCIFWLQCYFCTIIVGFPVVPRLQLRRGRLRACLYTIFTLSDIILRIHSLFILNIHLLLLRKHYTDYEPRAPCTATCVVTYHANQRTNEQKARRSVQMKSIQFIVLLNMYIDYDHYFIVWKISKLLIAMLNVINYTSDLIIRTLGFVCDKIEDT